MNSQEFEPEVQPGLMDMRGILAASEELRPEATADIWEKRSLASPKTFGSYSELSPSDLRSRAIQARWKLATHPHVSRHYKLYQTGDMGTGHYAVQKITEFTGERIYLEHVRSTGKLIATSKTVKTAPTTLWFAITEMVPNGDTKTEVLVVILAGQIIRLPQTYAGSEQGNRWVPTADAKKHKITHVILDRSVPED